MPLELQIIRASEFIRLGAKGRLDLAASREILKLLARACFMRGINQALLDVRDIRPGTTPMLTSRDLATLVNAFGQMGFSEQLRLSVLYTSDPHRRARNFAFLTRLRGWNVKASASFEEALSWLSQGKEAEDGTVVEEQEFPVHIKRSAGARPSPPFARVLPKQDKASTPPSRRHRPRANED